MAKVTPPANPTITEKLIGSGLIKAKINENYEIDTSFQEGSHPFQVHSTPGLVKLLSKNEKVDIDARVLAYNKKTKEYGYRKLGKKDFLESVKTGGRKFRETDLFGMDGCGSGGCSPVGHDFVPLLGGPFNKQLYYYDYLRMHALAFQAYHHDPVAMRLVHTLRDFVLGRGFRLDASTDEGRKIVRMVEDANKMPELMDYAEIELSVYGENMVWELPNNDSRITYRLSPGQTAPKAPIPRFRLIDPSVIWEVVTYPEDISRVLYYQWVAPTQYQIYTGKDQGTSVPSAKFIFLQIPGGEVIHTKVNCVSNEKRGRSDLFPILGYLKRLRDSVEYSIIGQQKASAWSIDTQIQGSQTDIDDYIASVNAQGQFPPPGSEFVHTAAVTRQYLSNAATARGGNTSAFDWTLSMICMGFGIPMSYLGTHLSGGQTKASAFVSTEPVTKMIEKRQDIMRGTIREMFRRIFSRYQIDDEVEVSFPELITQDRSAKLKDLALAVAEGWMSKRRAAEISAKEFGVEEFEYAQEKQEIDAETPEMPAPLSAEPVVPAIQVPSKDAKDANAQKTSGVNGKDKRSASLAN